MSRLIFEHQTTMKTLTYCLMHFVVAITVAYLLSGNWAIALSIGIIEPLVQTFCYNLHERGWKKAADGYQRKYLGLMITN
ncbi:MAG: DUF2061 domain-containing protein [Rickettsiales bacterium]